MIDDPIVVAIEQRRREVHVCIVPGCGERARQHLYAQWPTRLAGRDWHAEFVDLCPAHAYELRQAADRSVVEGETAIAPFREWAG